MDKKIFMNRSLKDILVAAGPLSLFLILVVVFAYRNLEPAPPNHLTISTGDDQSDIQEFAKDYQDILKQDGVRLDIRSSEGPFENLRRLEDDKSDVSAAFVQDGLGSEDAQPDVVSLGSLYYEPLWVFYRSNKTLNHLYELKGQKIAAGRLGHGTHVIAQRLLRLSGIEPKDTKFINLDHLESAAALKKGEVDAAIFMLSPENPTIHELMLDPHLKLMNILQAEGISRKDASFHHLILPRGAVDLSADLPRDDIHLLASTNTLLVRDDLHPALVYLLLKAAVQIHSAPGMLEKRGEFPANKDDQFPVSKDAVQFYKSGGPFWQRYLPFWLAAWFDRFVLLVIPVLAIVLPLIRMIPKIYNWRIRSRIYQRYGELKFLETQITPSPTPEEYSDYYKKLDAIEERVNKMKIPKNFTEHIYSLRGHIQFVRDRLTKTPESET